MIHLKIRVHLTLLGPVLTQATNAGAFGIDASIARNRSQRPYLPYSLVRGKLRQSLEELQNALPAGEGDEVASNIRRWFGPRSESNDDLNQRGTLFFSDFVHPQAKPEDRLISRIAMNAETGTVQERMLLTVDTPFGYGEPVECVGEIRTILPDFDSALTAIQLLHGGLHWLTQLGAERTVGFGRVQSIRFGQIQCTDLTPHQRVASARPDQAGVLTLQSLPQIERLPCEVARPEPDPKATHYAIRLRPRGLLCFGGNRKRSNIFESETSIHGNALLGTLANMYCMASGLPPAANGVNEVQPVAGKPWQTLARHFAKLRITHAFPSQRGSGVRPVVWPLSLVAAEPSLRDVPDALYDVALCRQPQMIRYAGAARPPVFSIDWKGHVVTKRAERFFGWPEISRELRVRTAIDADNLRAEEEKLFAYEMVVPDNLEWLATIDLSRVPEIDRESLLADLRCLLSVGLGPLSKTKTHADVWIEPINSMRPQIPSDGQPLSGDGWVITLQTPAVLCGREDMDRSPDKLLAGYRRVFAELSGNTLVLERFFAKQSLSSVRFAGRLPHDSAGHYYPYVLTDEGSTFVLRSAGDVRRSQAQIEKWLACGIGLARSLATGFDPDSDQAWQHCPILDRNGFGEIIVNPPWLRNATADAPAPVLEKSI